MGMLLAAEPRLHSTRGGSSETELKELAVRPRKLPSANRVVMTVTPVANCDSACRKCTVSNCAVLRGELVFIVDLVFRHYAKVCPARPPRRAGGYSGVSPTLHADPAPP